MKKIKQIIIGFTILFAFQATTCEEDEPYAKKNITVPNLIKIETLNNYNVNDVLYIDASFSRFLPEEGYSTLLDIYRTSTSNIFRFELYLEKKQTDDTWLRVENSNAILLKGEYFGNNGEGLTILNATNNVYEFKVGFPLQTTGDFRLKVSKGFYQVVQTDKISLNITTTVPELNDEGFYSFTVI